MTSLGLYYLASLLLFSSVLVFRWMRRQHDVVVLLDSACPPWILASCVAAAVIVTRPQTKLETQNAAANTTVVHNEIFG